MPKPPAKKTVVSLPALNKDAINHLDELTSALKIPREVLAAEEEIEQAWQSLPTVLQRMAPDKRDAQIARMCVAVANGLFDGAVNYVWNAAIAALRQKILSFGLNVVAQIKGQPFDEKILNGLKDVELLQLCLEINLLSSEGHLFLDQCRDIRNSFSAAHPPIGEVDAIELINFVNRCAKHALGHDTNPLGVDVQSLLEAVDAGKLDDTQLEAFSGALKQTHDAQRASLFVMFHGIYCDPDKPQHARINALNLALAIVNNLSDEAKSNSINQHAGYVGKGDGKRIPASRDFFSRMGLLSLLGDSERHAVITKACERLYGVHTSMDNFYNEPPFAERLWELSRQASIPETAQRKFVFSVLLCAIGNGFGVSWAAMPFYHKMIGAFSPQEIGFVFDLIEKDAKIKSRLSKELCKQQMKEALGYIAKQSVPSKYTPVYDKWIK